MVSHDVPNNGQLSAKSKSSPDDQLKSVVKAEPLTPQQPGFDGGTPQWAPNGSKVQGQQPAVLGPTPSPPHRQSSAPCKLSPKVEHQLYGEREREASYEDYAQDRKRSKIRDSPHSISSQMQSQLLSPRGGAGSSGPILARESSVPTPKYNESHHSGDRSTTSQVAPGPRLTHSVSLNPLDEPSPLGLTLRKTPSLLDLISMKLAQGAAGDHGSAANADTLALDAAKNRAAKCLVPTVTAQDKLKASNFPATSLKVGTWERISRYEGDLVGKCYYAKRKLVWEVLENGLKSKIEIQWSDISAMKASCPENLPGTLEIEVSRPPLFFRETNPQPRKHTLWQATSDFTGGQATICKCHSLQFPEGVLNRHYEKLVQCDPRLKALVERTVSMRPTPFEHNSWLFDGKPQHLPTHQAIGQHSNSHDGNRSQPSFVHPHMHMLPGNGPVPHMETLLDPKPEVRLIKMHSNDLASPSSVMDARASDESGTSDTEDLRLCDDLSEYDGIDLTYPNSTSRVHDVPDVKPSCSNLFMIGEHVLPPDQRMLDEIAQVLLGESAASLSNEQAMALAAKVGQMSAALAEEFQLPYNVLPHALEGSSLSDANHVHPFSSFQVKSEMGQGDNEVELVGSVGNVPMNARLPHRDPSCSPLLSCFSKHGSAGDLLMNLPRVASLPQLLETPWQAPVGRYDPAYMKPSYFGSEKLR